MGYRHHIIQTILHHLSSLKPLIRWLILGLTFFFLTKTLKDHWQEVFSIQIHWMGWIWIALALVITLLAHIWAGWIWSWILQDLRQPVSGLWGVQTYLKTNIAKYLPGNIWHLQGRVWVAKSVGIPLGIATLAVLLEPLFMATAALLITFLMHPANWLLKGISLLGLLAAVHPLFLNRVLQLLHRLKLKNTQTDTDTTTQKNPKTFEPIPPKTHQAQATYHHPTSTPPVPVSPSVQINQYPYRLLLGELGFISLRSLGFVLTIMALQPIEPQQVSLLISTFSLAWLLGFIVPGAPGGIGIFEATAIALLHPTFPQGLVLSVVAVYRLVNTLAEAMGAGLVWLDEQFSKGKRKA